MTELATAILLQEFGFSISALLVNIVNYARNILVGFILASIVISFFPGYPSNRFFQIVFDAVRAVVDPILRPIRSVIPALRIGGFALDLSPLVALIGLSIARSLLLVIIGEFIQPITG